MLTVTSISSRGRTQLLIYRIWASVFSKADSQIPNLKVGERHEADPHAIEGARVWFTDSEKYFRYEESNPGPTDYKYV